jgi:hypothetical protein
MVKPLRAVIAATVCSLVSGCLITTPRTVITISGFNTRDSAKARRVCAAVAAHNGLALRENDRGVPPGMVAYAKPMRTMFGDRDYADPGLSVADSVENAAIVVVGAWSDTSERRKLADDALSALQREFGTKRVQRRDDRWTEF